MEWIELGELVEVKGGGTPLRRKKEYWTNGQIPWVKISDIKGNRVRNTEEFITKEGFDNSSVKLIKKGSIIYTIFATIGKVAILEIDATTNQAIVGLEVKEDNIIDKFYLLYFLQSIEKEIKKQSRGVAQNNINIGIVKRIKIPVPPIKIQKQIVEVLDESQILIDNRKEQIELLDDLIESVFYDMFGDPIVNSKDQNLLTLDKICNLKAGKFIKASQILDLNKNNIYPCYGGNGLRGYVKEYSHNGLYPLIGRQGALCGNINFAEGKFYATEHAIVVSPIIDLDISWLYIMLKRMNLNRLASGAAQPGLNVGDLKLINVIYPSIDEQVKFGDRFRKIESQKQLLEESLKLLEDNYNSLIQRAFKGELF